MLATISMARDKGDGDTARESTRSVLCAVWGVSGVVFWIDCAIPTIENMGFQGE